MKALTVKQPWAWMIFRGKDIENRTWRTYYRGKLLIHAGASFDYDANSWVRANIPHTLAVQTMIGSAEQTFSAILGYVDLVDCIQDSKSPWAQPGCWHWVLKNPVKFEKPIPFRGALSLWVPPKEVVDEINKRGE